MLYVLVKKDPPADNSDKLFMLNSELIKDLTIMNEKENIRNIRVV